MTEFNPIIFPGLGIQVDPNPVAFSIFGNPIYFYGIIIGAGFLTAVLYCLHQWKKAGYNENNVLDFLLIVTPLSIIGARLYYVLWNMGQYQSLLDVINIRKGGLAIYGAIITAILITIIYFKWKKMPILPFLDIGAIGLLIGQSIGRWGNFINREAYGRLCELPWRMEIYSEYYGKRVSVHPTFLYESLWNLLGILLLHSYAKRKKFSGEIFLLYIGWYGLGRSVIEGLRTDSLYLFATGIRISQLIGVLSFLAAACLLLYLHRKNTYQKFPILSLPEKEIAVAEQEPTPQEEEHITSDAAQEEEKQTEKKVSADE